MATSPAEQRDQELHLEDLIRGKWLEIASEPHTAERLRGARLGLGTKR